MESQKILAETRRLLATPKHQRRAKVRNAMVESLEDISPELVPALKRLAEELGTDVESVIVRLLKKGLGDPQREEPTPLDKAPAQEPIEPLTHQELLEINANIQGFLSRGQFAAAKDLERVVTQRGRYEQKPTPSELQQRFIDSIRLP